MQHGIGPLLRARLAELRLYRLRGRHRVLGADQYVLRPNPEHGEVRQEDDDPMRRGRRLLRQRYGAALWRQGQLLLLQFAKLRITLRARRKVHLGRPLPRGLSGLLRSVLAGQGVTSLFLARQP